MELKMHSLNHTHHGSSLGANKAPSVATLGLTASGRRKIKSGAQYNKYFSKASGNEVVEFSNGSTYDTLKLIVKKAKQDQAQAAGIAPILKGSSRYQTCKNIWDFFYNYFQYKEDPSDREQVKSLRSSWANRTTGVDCDDFSVSIGMVLNMLNIPWYVKKISQSQNKWFHHVYVVVPVQGEKITESRSSYIVIDPVVDAFNSEPAHVKSHTEMGKITYLNGLEQQQANLFMQQPSIVSTTQQQQQLGSVAATINKFLGRTWNDGATSIYNLAKVAQRTTLRQSDEARAEREAIFVIIRDRLWREYHLFNKNVFNGEPPLMNKAEVVKLFASEADFDRYQQSIKWTIETISQNMGVWNHNQFTAEALLALLGFLDKKSERWMNIEALTDLDIDFKEHGVFAEIRNSGITNDVSALRNSRIVTGLKSFLANMMRFNPLMAVLRFGYLTAIKLNLGLAKAPRGRGRGNWIAARMYPAVISEAEAKRLGYSNIAISQSKRAYSKLADRFAQIGGKTENLNEAIIIGWERNVRNRKIDVDINLLKPDLKSDVLVTMFRTQYKNVDIPDAAIRSGFRRGWDAKRILQEWNDRRPISDNGGRNDGNIGPGGGFTPGLGNLGEPSALATFLASVEIQHVMIIISTLAGLVLAYFELKGKQAEGDNDGGNNNFEFDNFDDGSGDGSGGGNGGGNGDGGGSPNLIKAGGTIVGVSALAYLLLSSGGSFLGNVETQNGTLKATLN